MIKLGTGAASGQGRPAGGLQDFLFGLECRFFRNISLGAADNRIALNV